MKKGKQEQYVKDDAGLNDYLLQLALEKTRLLPAEDTPPIQGQGLEQLAREFLAAQGIINRLGHRYDVTLLEALIDQPLLEAAIIGDRDQCRAWFGALEDRANILEPGAHFQIDVEFGELADGFRARINKRLHGVHKIFDVAAGFFASGDYRPASGFWRTHRWPVWRCDLHRRR